MTSKANYILLLLASLALVRGLAYRILVPPWQSPDEPGHFELIALIAELGRIPTEADHLPDLNREINLMARDHHFAVWEQADPDYNLTLSPPGWIGPREAGYQYPLYYQLLAPIYRLLREQPISARYYTLVFVSSGLAAAVVVTTALTARTLFPRDPSLQIAMPAIVLLWPMQGYIAASLSNDNLVTLAGACSCLTLVLLQRYGLTWRVALIGAFTILLSVLAKRTSMHIAILVAFAFGDYGFRHLMPQLPLRVRSTVLRLCLVLGSGAMLALIFLLSSTTTLYDILRFMLNIPYSAQLEYARNTAIMMLDALAQRHYLQPENLVANSYRLRYTFTSFFASYGWSNTYLPDWVYSFSGTLGLAAFAGLVLFFWKQRHRHTLEPWQTRALFFFALAVVFSLAFVIVAIIPRPPASTSQVPGRYFQSLLPSLSALLLLGLRHWVPGNYHKLVDNSLIAYLVVLEAFSLGLTILPKFYG